ncbi:TetR family transcriptional regulator C-terminal domain-containing protein [Streptomyces sp. NPDC002520]
MDETAQRVRRVIDTVAVTQRAFAARIGLEPTKLSKSLQGNRRFTADELSAVAAAGGVSVDWLMHGRGTGPAPAPERRSADPVDAEGNGDDRRRTEFLQAAWKLISEQGYHSVRIADIARACGTSSGAVHYYFPTKQDVLNAALLHCVTSAFERQSVELRAVDSAYERLVRLIDMQLPADMVRDEWLVWLQFWAETALRPELRAIHNGFYARWRETVVRIVRRGQRQGQFRADADAERLALGLTALTDGLAIQVLTGSPEVTAERMRGVLLDFIERELLARKGGSHDGSDD